ncbi:hypothetical protein Tco_0409459 [Tanacetum coccineum]
MCDDICGENDENGLRSHEERNRYEYDRKRDDRDNDRRDDKGKDGAGSVHVSQIVTRRVASAEDMVKRD